MKNFPLRLLLNIMINIKMKMVPLRLIEKNYMNKGHILFTLSYNYESDSLIGFGRRRRFNLRKASPETATVESAPHLFLQRNHLLVFSFSSVLQLHR